MSFVVLVSFLLQGTLSQASRNLINGEGIKIKNALQALIYRKTLSLSASCFAASRAPTAAEGASATKKKGKNSDESTAEAKWKQMNDNAEG